MIKVRSEQYFFTFLAALKRAWRQTELLRRMSRSLIFSLPAAAVLYCLRRLFPVLPLWPAVTTVPAVLLVSGVLGLSVKFSPIRALCAADAVLNQKSALLTAFRLFTAKSHPEPLEKLFLERTAARCPGFQARQVFPLTTGLSMKTAAAVLFLSAVLLLFPIYAAPLFTASPLELTADARNTIEELERQAAELAESGDLNDRELASRMEGLYRRIVERSISKREAQSEVQLLKREIQRRVAGLERDVVEDTLPPDQAGLSPENSDLALRRPIRPELTRPANRIEMRTGRAAGSQGSRGADETQTYSQALSTLDELAKQLGEGETARPQAPQGSENSAAETAESSAPPAASAPLSELQGRDNGRTGPENGPVPAESDDSGDLDESGRSVTGTAGTTGSLAGESVEQDRFLDNFEFTQEQSELPLPESFQAQDTGESGTLQPESRIVTRSEAEVGRVGLKSQPIDPDFVQAVEGVMDRYRIPIDARAIASEYLYSVGLSEAEQNHSVKEPESGTHRIIP